MKYITIFLVCFSFISSCKKPEPIIDEGPAAERDWGDLNASKNGSSWHAKCQTRLHINYPDKFSLGFAQYNAAGFLRNSLNCRNLLYRTGEYFPAQLLYDGSQPDSALTISCYSVLSDGDVAGDTFVMIRDSAVVVSIDSIDYTSGIIAGKFSGTFVKVLTFGMEFDPSLPDTLIYTNGHYRAHVID